MDYLEVMKARVDGALKNLPWWKVSPTRGLDLDDLRGPFQPKLLHGPVESLQHENTHVSHAGQERYWFPSFDHQRKLVQQNSQRV